MDLSDAVALSEATDLTTSPTNTLAKLKTPMFLLAFTGKKSELNHIMANLPADGYVYWRSNQVGGKDVHRVILKDDMAAAIARMFGEDNPVQPLTVGELAEIRNILDIPWLPANKGFLTDRAHDELIRTVRQWISNTRWRLAAVGAKNTQTLLEDVSEQLLAEIRRPLRHERR